MHDGGGFSLLAGSRYPTCPNYIWTDGIYFQLLDHLEEMAPIEFTRGGELVVDGQAVRWWGLRILIAGAVLGAIVLSATWIAAAVPLSLGTTLSVAIGLVSVSFPLLRRIDAYEDLLLRITAPPPSESGVPLALSFSVLCDGRRRTVLSTLANGTGTASLSQLVDEVASWEYEVPRDRLTSQQRKRAYVGLYQTHLPRMDGAGAVTYDGDAGSVSITERGRSIHEQWELLERVFSARLGVSARGEYDDLFAALRNTRRRYTIYSLLHRDGHSGHLGDLSDRIAAWEGGYESDAVPPDERKPVYVDLSRTHVPELEREAIVEYRESDGTVSLTDRGVKIGRALSVFEDESEFPLEEIRYSRIRTSP